MAEVELECAVYGEGTVFPVKIARDAIVSALQEAIFDKKRYKKRYSFAASDLTLYLAKKDGAWLKSDRTFETFLKQGRHDDSGYEKMIPNWTLDDEDYFGDNSSLVAKRFTSWWNSHLKCRSTLPHPKQPFFKLFCRTFLQMLRQL